MVISSYELLYGKYDLRLIICLIYKGSYMLILFSSERGIKEYPMLSMTL